jgi:predicted transcriptional regulator
MPRIRQLADKYAREDFSKEIRRKQGEMELMSVRALAEATDIPPSTLGPKLREPDKMDVVDLRKIVKTLSPDPAVVLRLLGYETKTANKYS